MKAIINEGLIVIAKIQQHFHELHSFEKQLENAITQQDVNQQKLLLEQIRDREKNIARLRRDIKLPDTLPFNNAVKKLIALVEEFQKVYLLDRDQASQRIKLGSKAYVVQTLFEQLQSKYPNFLQQDDRGYFYLSKWVHDDIQELYNVAIIDTDIFADDLVYFRHEREPRNKALKAIQYMADYIMLEFPKIKAAYDQTKLSSGQTQTYLVQHRSQVEKLFEFISILKQYQELQRADAEYEDMLPKDFLKEDIESMSKLAEEWVNEMNKGHMQLRWTLKIDYWEAELARIKAAEPQKQASQVHMHYNNPREVAP